jgi:hypothetical protein
MHKRVVVRQTDGGESVIVLSLTRLVIYSEIRRLVLLPHLPFLLGNSTDWHHKHQTASAFYVDSIETGRRNSNPTLRLLMKISIAQ